MNITDRKERIKNYIDTADEELIDKLLELIDFFEKNEIDVWDELPKELKAEYERIISGVGKEDGISHKEMQQKARNLADS